MKQTDTTKIKAAKRQRQRTGLILLVAFCWIDVNFIYLYGTDH